MLITTSYSPTEQCVAAAQGLAKCLGGTYRDREGYSLRKLFERYGAQEGVIITKTEWRYVHQQGHTFVFHPNWSVVRMKLIRQGENDSLISVSELGKGDRFLDCTLGMGADAIVASYVVGREGQVVGLESQPVLATMVAEGLRTYSNTQSEYNRAMRAIQVKIEDYRAFLPQLPDNSFDVVYFDPMFRETVTQSVAMQRLKPLANPDAVDLSSVIEAKRVARRMVILKERIRSGEFERLGFSVVKEAANYAWGVIR